MSGLAAITVFLTSQLLLLVSVDAQTDKAFALRRVDSTPHTLLIGWNVTERGYDVMSSKIQIEVRKKGRDMWMNGTVSSTAHRYTVHDLFSNSQYTVCLRAELIEIQTSTTDDHEQCVTMMTPPQIRPDSLLGLFAVIGFLLAMVLLGYICWSRANSNLEEEEEGELSPIEEKIESNESRPFLLSAQPVSTKPARPRSTIEDADIPYITPTWEQLAANEKNA